MKLFSRLMKNIRFYSLNFIFGLFAIVFAGFALVHKRRLLRNTFLCFVSIFFYYKTSGLFVIILIFSIFYDYFIGKKLATTERTFRRKCWLFLGVFINLSILFYFKYAYFFTDAYNSLFHSDLEVINYLALWTNELTGTSRFDASKILLPVGIPVLHFSKHQLFSRCLPKKVAPVNNILDFGFYTTFFPQLVAV